MVHPKTILSRPLKLHNMLKNCLPQGYSKYLYAIELVNDLMSKSHGFYKFCFEIIFLSILESYSRTRLLNLVNSRQKYGEFRVFKEMREQFGNLKFKISNFRAVKFGENAAKIAVTRLDVTAFFENTVVLGEKFVFELNSFNANLTALFQDDVKSQGKKNYVIGEVPYFTFHSPANIISSVDHPFHYSYLT